MEDDGKKKNKRKTASNCGTPVTTRNSETIEELKSLKAAIEILANENKELKEKVADSLKSTEFINEKFEQFKKNK